MWQASTTGLVPRRLRRELLDRHIADGVTPFHTLSHTSVRRSEGNMNRDTELFKRQNWPLPGKLTSRDVSGKRAAGHRAVTPHHQHATVHELAAQRSKERPDRNL